MRKANLAVPPLQRCPYCRSRYLGDRTYDCGTDSGAGESERSLECLRREWCQQMRDEQRS
jgi:hypothetical protein